MTYTVRGWPFKTIAAARIKAEELLTISENLDRVSIMHSTKTSAEKLIEVHYRDGSIMKNDPINLFSQLPT